MLPNQLVCDLLRRRTISYYNNPSWVPTGSTTSVAHLGACFGIAIMDFPTSYPNLTLRTECICHVWNELTIAFLR